jgi:polyhydroxyalkanoate synthase
VKAKKPDPAETKPRKKAASRKAPARLTDGIVGMQKKAQSTDTLPEPRVPPSAATELNSGLNSGLNPGANPGPDTRQIAALRAAAQQAATQQAAEPDTARGRYQRFRSLDTALHLAQSRLADGLAPLTVFNALSDWWLAMANSPGKQAALAEKALADWTRFWARQTTFSETTVSQPAAGPGDRRFADTTWGQWPYRTFADAFLTMEDWWNEATSCVPGVSGQHDRQVNFMARQALDRFAPSNFPWTNPEVVETTREQQGFNFVRGAQNFADDWRRLVLRQGPAGIEDFQVGVNLATTPGKVIYRNRLIELIQYAPATDTVHREPVLIVPAWIMKYYILDLSAHNSLVRYLVEQGHTVFMISWKNPGTEDGDLSLDDYRRLGVMAAVDAVSSVVPDTPIHACGYCLGGTILSIAAATMARDHDDRLASLSLLAAQTDFSEAGELTLFIDESALNYLDSVMAQQGYLDTSEMAAAFTLLRSNDLIWSRIVRQYMLGEREPMIDLMAWNADATRMPYLMHSQYLRALFLENRLSRGRFAVEGQAIALSDLRVPIFAVGATNDHIAPWQSVYKINLLTKADTTFVLATGGHNAGIVSEPGHPRRSYQIAARDDNDSYIPPERWAAVAPRVEGSWWTAWQAWLTAASSGQTAPPPMGAPEAGLPPLADAPGTYVFQK